jgi:hypothetical protein
MKLFVFYMGGRISGCKIELHDVAFCVADRVEDCYESVKKQWVGELKGLHLDAFAALTHADGHSISVVKKTEPIQELHSFDKQLFFVNLGGYDTHHFTEIHKTGFYVAATAQEAKAKAKESIEQALKVLHTDDIIDIDDCINMNEHLGDYRLCLMPSEAADATEFICGYHLVP